MLSKPMNKSKAYTISILLALFLAFSVSAETRYVDDTLYAPLRSGEGLGFRIVHKGVKSGTPLELLTSNSQTGYSRVRTPEGIEGWLPSRFLVKEPIARTRLEQLTEEHEAIQKSFREISAQNQELLVSNTNLTSRNSELADSNQDLQAELADIKRISSNAVNLDRRNSELREVNEQLKNELEVLTSENIRLTENNDRDKMLLGGALVLSGILVAVIIPMFKKDKRDSW